MLNVYTDGSYNEKTKTYGWSYALYSDEDLIDSQAGAGNGEAASMRNVAGELSAVMHAVKDLYNRHVIGEEACSQLNTKLSQFDVTIYHDYTGVANWVDGSWKAKNDFTKAYKAFMNKYLSDGRLKVKFICIHGHTGIAGNEEADRLAKQACGVA